MLAERHKEEYGLNRCLRALGLSKSTWQYRGKKAERRKEKKAEEEQLKERIVDVVEAHPAYGYRRIWEELIVDGGEPANHKRLRPLLHAWDLALYRTVNRPRPSGIREILASGTGQLNLVKGWSPGVLERVMHL